MNIRRTAEFDDWLKNLKDRQGRARIIARIDRLAEGNPGKSRSVGSGLIEMKIDFGPGYRVYYVKRGAAPVMLLCGGDKSTQSDDIERAKMLASQLADEE